MRKTILLLLVLISVSCKKEDPVPWLDIWHINSRNSDLLSDAVSSQLYGDFDLSWFGTPIGISLHEGDQTRMGWTDLTTDNGLVSSDILAIEEDPSGAIWIGTGQGLSIYLDGNISNYSTGTPLEGRRIQAITIPCSGIAWLGCDNGLSLYRDHGLSFENDLQVFNNQRITAIFQGAGWGGIEYYH